MDARKRVLVVDDEPAIVNMLRIRLRLAGYDVVTATNGADAIELARTQSYDVIVLDILMPQVTGLDVLTEVRKSSRVPVLIITAKPDLIPLALKLGANDFVAKPLDPDLLVRKIASVLSKGGGEDAPP